MFVCNVKNVSIKSEQTYTYYSEFQVAIIQYQEKGFTLLSFKTLCKLMEKLEEKNHKISTFSFKKYAQYFII